MAIIKNFLKEKEKIQNNNEVDYKERIRAHKLSVFFRTVIVIAGVITLAFVLNALWKGKTFSSVNVKESYPISIVSSAGTMNLGGSLLIYSKDGASCTDVQGKAIWNQSFEMQSPIVAMGKKTVAIGDYNGRTIYVANNEKIMGTVKTNLPIRSVAVSDTGVVAAVLDDSDIIRIYVYDANTDTDTPIVEAKATMNKSGYPMTVALSPNGKIMMVSYFYVDSGNMKSSIAFYNFGEVGSNEVDNYVSGYDYMDAVIPYAVFMDEDSAFAVGDDRVVFFSGNEKPTNVASAIFDSEVVGVYYNEEYVGMLFRDITGESTYRLDVYNDKGVKEGSIPFDLDYTDIIINKSMITIYNKDSMIISSPKGQIKFRGAFDKNVIRLIPTNSIYKYVMVSSDSIDAMELN